MRGAGFDIQVCCRCSIAGRMLQKQLNTRHTEVVAAVEVWRTTDVALEQQIGFVPYECACSDLHRLYNSDELICRPARAEQEANDMHLSAWREGIGAGALALLLGVPDNEQNEKALDVSGAPWQVCLAGEWQIKRWLLSSS